MTFSGAVLVVARYGCVVARTRSVETARHMIQCIVYNASHEPLAVVTAERGLVLHLEGKAIILEELQGRRFRSPNAEFPIPTSVVLKEYKKTGAKYYGPAQLNQRNLFLRDAYTCQYCARHLLDLKRREYLTRDHVMPISRGGKDEWTNVVTACSTCNHKKDDHTPEEAELTLQRKPKEPTVFEILTRRSSKHKASLAA